MRKPLSFLADSGVALLLFWTAIAATGANPIPKPLWVLYLLGAGALLWGVGKLTGATPGTFLFPRASEAGSSSVPDAAGERSISAARFGGGIFLTLALWAGAVFFGSWIAFNSPLLKEATLETREAALPKSLPDSGTILPFYYAMGAWPQQYEGRPVFHVVPYERSIPFRFLPKVIARWKMPDVFVTFEGPRTPSSTQGSAPPPSRAQVRECLLRNVGSDGFLGCAHLRESVLGRHIAEMKTQVKPEHWELQWLHVRNPALPPDQEVQGIYLRAEGKGLAQDRFVLVTEKGSHQAFILSSRPDADGEQARRTFAESIASLRVSDDLGPGRAWADEQLQSIQLSEIKAAEESGNLAQFLSLLARTQALLAAKATVDSKTFDTFFHMAGTALMLSRFARSPPSPCTLQDSYDWKAIPKGLADAASRYGRDLAPNDPRAKQLEMMALDVK